MHLGVNQTQIAAIAGVSQPTVHRWLDGTKVPDANDLCRLADHFNVSVDGLLGRAALNLPAVSFAAKRPEAVLADAIEGEADRRLAAGKVAPPTHVKRRQRPSASQPTKKPSGQ